MKPFSKRFLREVTDPCLLVLRGKHGDKYIHIPDLEALAKVALRVLGDRLASGNYYTDPGAEPVRPDVGDPKALPSGIRKEAEKKLQIWSDSHARWEEEKIEIDEIRDALRNDDGEAAWNILCQRSDAEYEEVDLCPYTDVTKDLSEF